MPPKVRKSAMPQVECFTQAIIAGVPVRGVRSPAGLGQHDEALSWFEKAAEEREGYLPYLNHTWMFEPLSSDPRYQALLRKMNFPQQS